MFALLCCACAVLCLQRFFSATLQNFATQSLLMAVGVGARKALAASAAINWMLKDGMNRLVRMGVATQFGESFDSDLKVCVGCVALAAGAQLAHTNKPECWHAHRRSASPPLVPAVLGLAQEACGTCITTHVCRLRCCLHLPL